MGFAMYAHPVDKTEMLKVTVLYEGKVSRFLMESESIESEPIEEEVVIEESTKSTGIIYPKSSIGADITKYDIPTITRDTPRDPKIAITFDSIDSIFINNQYTPNIIVTNQDHQKIIADVNLKIVRDGDTIINLSSTASKGMWSPIINIVDYKFSPGFCYDVTVTATLGNLTATATDDFIVVTTAKYWDRTLSPIDSDSHCNE